MPLRTPTPNRDSATPRSGREDSPSLVPGELLGGKYRIEARLAEGGMGVVMRATHLDLDCPVAIKLLRPELSTNDDVIARLLAEARIAASLRSKHVNRVLDVGRTPLGVPYLVLEYLEGCDLGGYLERRGPLPIAEAVDYVMQACEALAEAHAIGIVHRDLKPENLFLAEEADGGFVLKVLDFGISKAPASRSRGRTLTNPFEVVGSPTYMSPEQIRGGSVDPRTDVWALGAVLYELCTASILFDEETITATFKRVLDPGDLPPPLPGGEEATRVREIIVRCLAREPDRRYQDMVELARALAPLGSDALQAARVTKVASAARARFIAMSSQDTAPLAGTPFALTTSRAELAMMTGERPFAPKRRFRTWSVVAAATLAAAVGGVRHWALQEGAGAEHVAPAAVSPPSTPPPPPAWQEPPGAPTPPTTVSLPAPPVATPRPAFVKAAPPRADAMFVKAMPSSSAAAAAAESGTVEVAQRDAALAVTEPTAHLEASAPAPEGEPAPGPASFDAWDPKTFGGRK